MKYVIIDIDNTICKKYPEREFWELDKVHLDTPITPVVRVLENLCTHDDVFPIFITARLESSREVTVAWLKENTVLPICEDTPSLFMTPEVAPPSYDIGFRGTSSICSSDPCVKRFLLENFLECYETTKESILGVFDDNQACNTMWRAEGLFVFDVNQAKPPLLTN